MAEAARGVHARGSRLSDITPVWRILDPTAPTIGKLAAENAAFIAERRSREGL